MWAGNPANQWYQEEWAQSSPTQSDLVKTSVVRGLALLANLTLCGCAFSVGPDYEPPSPIDVDRWAHAVESEFGDPSSPMYGWWALLQDQTLTELIERAHRDNLDLDAAVARVRESRALLAIAGSARVPDLTGTGGAERGRGSDGISPAAPPQERTDTLRELGLQSTWELDLWGRVRRSVESASASYEASVEDLRDIVVIVYAQIGANYVLLRTLQERLRLAKANVELQKETLALVEARHRAQLAPLLDVRQAELNLAVTESVVPSIEASIATTLHQLSVLVGEPPNTLSVELGIAQPLPSVPATLVASIPADTIRQRPDIRGAERRLAAQSAQIGVATSDLYPNFFLSGDFGYATAAGSLLQRDYRTWGLGTVFSWNLFNAGRVRNSIAVEEARTEQALVNYEQTILFALQDVEDSLVSFARERERLDALGRSVTAADQADELVTEQYRQGLTNFQNVLDTQRSLFEQQDQYADSQGLVLLNLISAYQAFGGGWDVLGMPAIEE